MGITLTLFENSYTTVSSHSVRVSVFGLWIVVIEEDNCLARLGMRHWSLLIIVICREDTAVIVCVYVSGKA